ncbi:S41 family peptidase [Streptomyces koyangensis]|uniref:S41 family peptidase n=1 Tax=Streptomyces koyangensis TaxID=188770 RepID=UPI001CECA93C|nr:S41 family peptidase [Streptomyces koyangensis]
MDAARLRRPLLGDGEVGAFVAANGTRTPWRIESGTPRQYADRWGPGEPLARPMPPVAVLTGPRTASAGEAVAIAFRGTPRHPELRGADLRRPHRQRPLPPVRRRPGRPDHGPRADRTGRVHHGPLPPDVEVEWVRGSSHVLAAATDWLAAHDRCRDS